MAGFKKDVREETTEVVDSPLKKAMGGPIVRPGAGGPMLPPQKAAKRSVKPPMVRPTMPPAAVAGGSPVAPPGIPLKRGGKAGAEAPFLKKKVEADKDGPNTADKKTATGDEKREYRKGGHVYQKSLVSPTESRPTEKHGKQSGKTGALPAQFKDGGHVTMSGKGYASGGHSKFTGKC